jgi:hypothetical protein
LEGLAKNAETEEDIPISIRNRPRLDQFEQDYWQAYLDLSGSRQFTSAGVAEIPYKAKIAWLDEHEIYDPDERRDYFKIITHIDNAFLEHYYEKNKAPGG